MIAAVNTSPLRLPLLRKTNTWYSVRDGNWSDVNTWMSNGLDRKNHASPQPGDNVYINHMVSLDYSANNNVSIYNINNLYGSGTLVFGSSVGLTVNINGVLNMSGTIDSSNSSHTLNLNNCYLSLGIYIAGTAGIVVYNQSNTVGIMNFSYRHLSIKGGASTKYMTSDLTILGNLTLQNSCTLELGSYNLTVNGITNINGSTISRSIADSGALFKTMGNVVSNTNNTINLGTTNDWEMQGGYSPVSETIIVRTLIISVNQSWVPNGTSRQTTLNGNIQINSGITLTLTDTSFTIVLNTGTINGINGTSTLSNYSCIKLKNATIPMSTGIFTMQTSGSMGYLFNGNYTIPYTSLNNLFIDGTGTKTLSGDTTITGWLSMPNNGTLDLGSYNFTVTGSNNTLITSGLNQLQIGSIVRSVANSGKIFKYTGLLSNNNSTFIINLGSTNDMELQGGFALTNITITCGNLILSATQTLTDNSVAHVVTLNGNITIGGGFTVTLSTISIILNGVLNGSNSGSIFINNSILTYKNPTAPMATGKLYCNQATNRFTYGLAGNQDITVPSDPVSPGYKNLTLNGSGIKRLLGNVSVKGTYTLTSPATLNSNGFALTNP